jgi:hypothetical protein
MDAADRARPGRIKMRFETGTKAAAQGAKSLRHAATRVAVNDQTAAAWMIARVDTSPGRSVLRLLPIWVDRVRPETIKRLLLSRCQTPAPERPTRE